MTPYHPDPRLRAASLALPVALGLAALALGLAFVGSYAALADCDARLCLHTRSFFALGQESNLPTWFSSTCWTIAGILCVPAALSVPSISRGLRGYWFGLAGISLFLSMDEAAMFHERFGTEVGRLVGNAGTGLYFWQIYAVGFLSLVVIIFFRFLKSIPAGTRTRLLMAAVVFVSGALIAESVESLFLREGAPFEDSPIRRIPMITSIQFLIEELLEMFGIILWIHTILHFLSTAPAGDTRVGRVPG